jgi:hypothetical protein
MRKQAAICFLTAESMVGRKQADLSAKLLSAGADVER